MSYCTSCNIIFELLLKLPLRRLEAELRQNIVISTDYHFKGVSGTSGKWNGFDSWCLLLRNEALDNFVLFSSSICRIINAGSEMGGLRCTCGIYAIAFRKLHKVS